MRKRVIALGTLGLLAAAAAPGQERERPPIRFDNWLYYQSNIGGSDRWQYQPRFYVPFNLPQGWTFTQRANLPMYYTNKVGPDNPTGGWKGGIGDWSIEEIFTSPELAPNFRMAGSVRFVFPTGGSSPFGSNQYQWAPMIGAIYAIPERKITVAPLARYFMSYHATEPGAAQVRRLDLYPTVTFGLPDNWSLSFYNENPIDYNEINHSWFVPIDVLLIKRLNKTVEFAFGGAWGIVKEDPAYRYIINGRLTFYF